MVETRRPVFFSGENPGIGLYVPGTEQVTARVSYWYCTDSPWGVGHALVLWFSKEAGLPSQAGCGGVFTDNLELAQVLVEKLTQNFPEFEGIAVDTLPSVKAQCEHHYDGARYRVLCQAGDTQAEVVWSEILDRKQILWPGFPAGGTAYDLTTVICPCRTGEIRINGDLAAGEVKTVQGADGRYSSTAFLAFAETWIGPLEE